MPDYRLLFAYFALLSLHPLIKRRIELTDSKPNVRANRIQSPSSKTHSLSLLSKASAQSLSLSFAEFLPYLPYLTRSYSYWPQQTTETCRVPIIAQKTEPELHFASSKDMGLYDFYKGQPFFSLLEVGKRQINTLPAQDSNNHSTPWFVQYVQAQNSTENAWYVSSSRPGRKL